MKKHKMICVCDSTGLLEAEILRLRTQRLLGIERSEDTLAAALHLLKETGAKVSYGADQWCEVGVQFQDFDECVECDEPFDGLFFLLHRFIQCFHECLTAKGLVTRSNYKAARAVSVDMLKRHATIEEELKNRYGDSSERWTNEDMKAYHAIMSEFQIRWAGTAIGWVEAVWRDDESE